jgi:hypothetical protein
MEKEVQKNERGLRFLSKTNWQGIDNCLIGSFLFNIDPKQFFAGKFRTQHIYLNPYHQMKIL